MSYLRKKLILIAMLVYGLAGAQQPQSLSAASAEVSSHFGFFDASTEGFLPTATGSENTRALQKAVDRGGTVTVSLPGIYKLSGTVYFGSHTTLQFGEGVVLQKVDEEGPFTHVFLNKGALTKSYDEGITINGLRISVNGVDKAFTEVYGLRGQIAFFYVKDLQITGFRMMDLEKAQFGIHVCTFEDLRIDDVIIKGKKDGIHLGRGKRFAISNAVFETFDDAIALNGHDYATSNPEMGWIEDGVIEKCHDLNAENTTGYFCRILAGAWIDWKPGMQVQQSDAVVSNGRIYRVQAQPDGTVYTSNTRPTHASGSQVIDGINWGMVQEEVTYTAGVRNVVFRDIFLEKPRIAFSVHFDNDRYSRSYYPGATVPIQEKLLFDNVRVKYSEKKDFLSINTPIDVIRITNSVFRDNRIRFHANKAMEDYLPTMVSITNSDFTYQGAMDLLVNGVENKVIHFKSAFNTALDPGFSGIIASGPGQITVESDLPWKMK